VPVPLSTNVCGLLAALSAIVRVPLIVPELLGVKVTLTVQVLLAAMVPVQVAADTAKSPLAEMVPMVKAAFELVSVIVFAVAVDPIAVLGKVIVAGESVTGGKPLPERFTT
jgi:hypothetical protein